MSPHLALLRHHEAIRRSPLPGVKRNLWNFGSASLRLDVSRPDHLAPLLGFLDEELAEGDR